MEARRDDKSARQRLTEADIDTALNYLGTVDADVRGALAPLRARANEPRVADAKRDVPSRRPRNETTHLRPSS